MEPERVRSQTRGPATYLKVSGPVPKPTVSAAIVYTCPMHPQIRRNAPGSCPICGMTLEPVTPTGAAHANMELTHMTRRFWVALALTVPVFLLEMGSHIPTLGLQRIVALQTSIWIQFALSTPVVLWPAGRSSNAPGRRSYIAR